MSEETEHEEVKPEEVAVKPETVAHETHPSSELLSTVNALGERLTSLEGTVTGLLPQNRDESPVKRPWTHRNFK